METKKCNHCGRTVLANSKVCKHCGQSFGCEDIVLNETIKTESEQLQTSQSIDSEKNEDAIQQSIDNVQPSEEIRERKKWWLLAIAGILVVSFSIYWISRTHGEEVSAVIKIEEESELKNNEDEPEMKENIEFIAPELSSDAETENSDGVKLILIAPSAIAKGDQMRLTYTLQGGEGEEIKVPSSIKGFDILYGPSVARSSSAQIINGKTTSSFSESYTYILKAAEEGHFTLPSANIKVKGRIYTSNTALIKVLPPNANVDPEQEKQVVGSESKDAKVSPNDIFIKTIVSNKTIKEEESVTVTFKLYTIHSIKELGKINIEESSAFNIDEIELPSSRQFELEHYNGRNYYTVDIKKLLLHPQRSGKIVIPKMSIKTVLEISSGKKVETFFGPQYVKQEVTKEIVSSPASIDVKIFLPNSPSSSKDIKITANEIIMQGDQTAIDIKELSNSKTIYDKAEVMPSFPGGESALSQFISANLRYPVVAQESGIQGRAIIRFVVTRTGATSDVIVVRGFDPSCDKEAVRVVKAMPKWNPGIQDGNPVDVYFTLPISFTLTRNY